jgi:threonine dehydrogenase-like Zn-dependent dehydrogenase
VLAALSPQMLRGSRRLFGVGTAALIAGGGAVLVCDSKRKPTVPANMLAFRVRTAGDSVGELQTVPVPVPAAGEALVRVRRAGICNTDLEIMQVWSRQHHVVVFSLTRFLARRRSSQGYMGFTGILGHEFVGEVVHVEGPAGKELEGTRVCGDINCACSTCDICELHNDRSRNHCPTRTVLGIFGKDGTMAEYLTLPVANLHAIPDSLDDEQVLPSSLQPTTPPSHAAPPTALANPPPPPRVPRAVQAVFVEPLAAACRIVEQGLVTPGDRVAILGDGKLGLLIAEVIGRAGCTTRPIIFGKHAHKLAFVADVCDTKVIRLQAAAARDHRSITAASCIHLHPCTPPHAECQRSRRPQSAIRCGGGRHRKPAGSAPRRRPLPPHGHARAQVDLRGGREVQRRAVRDRRAARGGLALRPVPGGNSAAGARRPRHQEVRYQGLPADGGGGRAEMRGRPVHHEGAGRVHGVSKSSTRAGTGVRSSTQYARAGGSAEHNGTIVEHPSQLCWTTRVHTNGNGNHVELIQSRLRGAQVRRTKAALKRSRAQTRLHSQLSKRHAKHIEAPVSS